MKLLDTILNVLVILSAVIALDPGYTMKLLHDQTSINHEGCKISLRTFRSLTDKELSSLEVLRFEDIYDKDVKVAQTVHITTFYYELRTPSGYVEGPLDYVDKQQNQVYASLINNNDRYSPRPLAEEETSITDDHGFKDGINNKNTQPFVSALAWIAQNKLHVRGVVMDYTNGLTDDMLQENILKKNFALEIPLPIIADEPTEEHSNRVLVGLIVAIVTFLIYIVSSDAYKNTR